MQFEIEDILVNGPPWNTRIALRVEVVHPLRTTWWSRRVQQPRLAVLELKWGRLVAWEDYEDTERVAAWDRSTSSSPNGCHVSVWGRTRCR